MRLFVQIDSYFPNTTGKSLQRVTENRESISGLLSPTRVSLKDVRADLHACIHRGDCYHLSDNHP